MLGLVLTEPLGSQTVEVGRVEDDPFLVIGVLEGDPDQEFGRLTGVVLLDGETVAIADGAAGVIRWFSRDGTLLHHSGSIGSGPGEFRRLSQLQRLPGGKLWAFDSGLSRGTVFDATGQLEQVVTLHGAPARIGYGVLMSDGSVVGVEQIVGTWGSPPSSGLKRDSVRIWRFDPSGELAEPLAKVPGGEFVVRWTANPTERRIFMAPLAHWVVVSGYDGEVVVGTMDEFTVTVRDASWKPTRVIRLPDTSLRPDAALVERYRRIRGADESNIAPLPDKRPVYSRLFLDAEGRLWISEFQPSGVRPTSWQAYGSSGTQVLSLQMPEGVELMDVRSGVLASVREDEFGVQYVQLYRYRE